MKKITTYILLLASVVFASCEQEIFISRDHDINAEVSDIETKLNMKTLYCNLTDATANLEEVAKYIKAQDADVVMLLGSDDTFKEWASEFAIAENLESISLSQSGGVTVCLSKKTITYHNDGFNIGIQTTPILHCSVDGIHFVVAGLKAGGLVLGDGSHTEDFNADRVAQIEDIISNTIDNSAYYTTSKWVFAVDMESPAALDMVKYGVEDIMSENCVANDVMSHNGLIDCVASFNNYYVPSSADSSRHNFLYTTNKSWQMMQPLTVDTSVEALGVHHYPIMVTLKSEE